MVESWTTSEKLSKLVLQKTLLAIYSRYIDLISFFFDDGQILLFRGFRIFEMNGDGRWKNFQQKFLWIREDSLRN